MPIGTVEFWNHSRGEGAIVTAGKDRFRFTAAGLLDLAPGEMRRGLEVEFDAGSDATARAVRQPRTDLLAIPDALPRDHPLLSDIPLPARLRAIVEDELRRGGGHPGLRLDKYLPPAPDQEAQKRALAEVIRQPPADPALFE